MDTARELQFIDEDLDMTKYFGIGLALIVAALATWYLTRTCQEIEDFWEVQ